MRKNHEASPYALLSYPRAASHYLQNLLLTRFGITAERHHWFDQIKNKDRLIISIIRNPIDSIASNMSRVAYFGEVPGSIESHVRTYSDSIDEVLENADVIVDFEELISDPDSVAKKLSDILGLRLFDNGHDISVGRETSTSTFIPTSKNVEGYQDVLKSVSENQAVINIAEKYNAVLSKCI